MLKKSFPTFSERHAGSRRRCADAANKLRLALRRARSIASTGSVGPLVHFWSKKHRDLAFIVNDINILYTFSGPTKYAENAVKKGTVMSAEDDLRADAKISAAEDNPADAPAGPSDGSPQNRTEIPLPQVDFSTFLLSLASSALVQLGEVPSPEDGKKAENLLLAKHSIDIICMLQDKTTHGLSPEETRLLEGILYELRLKYVIKSQ
jgi:hypothetical protein